MSALMDALRRVDRRSARSALRMEDRVPVPSAEDRHLLSRFSYGVTPDLVAEADGSGGAMAWFEQQLESAPGSDRSTDEWGTDGLLAWWPHLAGWSPQRKAEANESGELTAYDQQADFLRWTLLRRIKKTSQVHEVMTEFWSNLLHVPAPFHKTFPLRFGYDETIRDHALGTFEDLLIAAVTHPAMLRYLDNERSTAEAPNENLGRELLELHTVGRESGFTEDDVWSSTRILTGWGVDTEVTWEPYYSAEDHYIGPVEVLGFSDDNRLADGQDLTRRYLGYLARHPSTATRVARRLAVRFVSDDPSVGLVDDLADVFESSGTDIKATLTALVEHPEFADAAGAKLRTPTEDLVASYRVLEIDVVEPTDYSDVAVAILGQSATMGQRPFDWTTPDGFPDVADAWASAGRMIGSWTIHRNSAASRPHTGANYRPHEHWLGELPVTFDDLVDRVCRLLVAQESTDVLLEAAGKGVDAGPDELITADHRVAKSRVPELLMSVLDSPVHMSR